MVGIQPIFCFDSVSIFSSFPRVPSLSLVYITISEKNTEESESETDTCPT